MASTSPQLNFWCPTSNSLGPARSFFDFLWAIDPEIAKGTYQHLPNLIAVETSRNPNCRTDNATHIPARLSQDTQEQETTQGRPWLTKSSGTQHPLSSSIIHHPLSLMFGFTPNLLGTTCENKQTGKRKYVHPNIHLSTPCTQSTVLWWFDPTRIVELKTLTATASRKLAHPTTAFWLILATGSSVSRFD